MDDLERRALLGDPQAQEECTRRGIALPCPICHKPVKVSVSRMLYVCSSCHITVSFNSFNVNPEDTLRIWNTRTAPPIGRCKDCAQFKLWGECNQTGSDVKQDDFCSDFAPKEN